MTAPKPYKAAAELKDDKSSIRTKRNKHKELHYNIHFRASQNLNSGSVTKLPTKLQSRQRPNWLRPIQARAVQTKLLPADNNIRFHQTRWPANERKNIFQKTKKQPRR